MDTYKKYIKNLYISTTFYKDNSDLLDVLNLCKKNKINNLELGSNHKFSLNYLKYCKKFKFNYLTHNYFPPAKKNLIINLASNNLKIRKKSIAHIKKCILFSKKIKSKLYTFHPGFVHDPLSQNKNSKSYDFVWKKKNNYKDKIQAFTNAIFSINEIISFAKANRVKIAIETEGSISKKDFLIMQEPREFEVFYKIFRKKEIGINLNIGHLNLASKAFNFSKENFIKKFKNKISCMEFSHNNGKQDQHKAIKKNQWYSKYIFDRELIGIPKVLEYRDTKIADIKKNLETIKKKRK